MFARHTLSPVGGRNLCSYSDHTAGWTTEEPGFDSRLGLERFFSLNIPIDSGTDQSSISMRIGVSYPEVMCQGLKLAIRASLVPVLRMYGALPPIAVILSVTSERATGMTFTFALP